MTQPIESTLEARLFGGRWSPATRSAAPTWVQIEEQLADRIASGALARGERLPPERELAGTLGVSRMTVRQALASLAARGLVERGVGRGTFVRARPKLDHDLSRVRGFTEQVERQGLAAGAEIHAVGEHRASAAVVCALDVEPGAPVVRLVRLRSAGGLPLALEDTWVPCDRFPGLLDHDLEGSLYALMRDAYDLAPVEAIERLEPVAARAHEARALRVPEGSPLMLVERTAFAAGGVAVEFANDRHRGDRARFVVRVVHDARMPGEIDAPANPRALDAAPGAAGPAGEGAPGGG
jgi:GntR family transcriptional regulator